MGLDLRLHRHSSVPRLFGTLHSHKLTLAKDLEMRV